MNAVSAFMNHVQAIVAIQTLDRMIARVARAAQHLDREFVRFETLFGRP